MASVDVTRIASNIGALNALNSLTNINSKLAMHQTRLSTGKRINSAMDDPAGLTIATKMLARSEGMKVAMDNIGDAKNMLSVAEAGMSKINDILVSMRSKAEQAASDTLGSSERSAIQTQLSAYASQIQDLVDQTKWNGVKLLDQTTGTKTFQTGADEGETVKWALADKLDPTTLSVSQAVTLSKTSYVSGTTTAITGDASVSAVTGLSKLDTGGYSIEILDKSTTAGEGNVNASGTMPSGVSGLAGNTALAANELDSGTYVFEITGGTSLGTRTEVSFRILNSSGVSVASNTNVDLSGTKALVDSVNGNTGMSITTASTLTSGTSVTFEYIKRNDVKYELNDSSGVAQTIAKDGAAASSTSTGLYGYVQAGQAAVNTGRGFQFDMGAFAAVNGGDYRKFDFLAAGDFVVDVSSAAKAASYMTTVNNSLDTVTKAMSNLGSLMARLTFKEDATASAQVNVESSYNRIMNANMAEEQVNASKYTILQQTATAMLAQANAAPQSLLTLFR